MSNYGIHVSEMGKNLIVAIVGGLVVGGVVSPFTVQGVPLIYFLIQDNALVLHGMLWQLVTSIIVAPFGVSGFIDVAFNAAAVYFLDPLLSAIYTPRQYYLTFIATGVFGNILSLFGLGLGAASFGASGGLFGLVAGAVSFDYALNRRVNMSLVMWFLIIFFFSSFAFAGVDYFAHMGGALLGLVVGYLIGNSRRKQFVYRSMYRF
ncbi:MAG: rhomboid family intramembrane serine protease [Candidatus Marsarchaeota archaeon]|nr:rhomboid family intramembrane serine protease [Candidatus Marsarchaeota archaeon]